MMLLTDHHRPPKVFQPYSDNSARQRAVAAAAAVSVSRAVGALLAVPRPFPSELAGHLPHKGWHLTGTEEA